MANTNPCSDEDIAKYESCADDYIYGPDPYYAKLQDRTEALMRRKRQEDPAAAMREAARKPDFLSGRYFRDLGNAPFHYRPLEQRFSDYSSYLQQYRQLHQESVCSIGSHTGSATTTAVNGIDSTKTTTTATSTPLPSTLDQSVKVEKKEEEAAASNEQVGSSSSDAALSSMFNDLVTDL